MLPHRSERDGRFKYQMRRQAYWRIGEELRRECDSRVVFGDDHSVGIEGRPPRGGWSLSGRFLGARIAAPDRWCFPWCRAARRRTVGRSKLPTPSRPTAVHARQILCRCQTWPSGAKGRATPHFASAALRTVDARRLETRARSVKPDFRSTSDNSPPRRPRPTIVSLSQSP